MNDSILKRVLCCMLIFSVAGCALTGCMGEPTPTVSADTGESIVSTPSSTEETESQPTYVEPEPDPLVLEYPTQPQVDTLEETITFRGFCDPEEYLLINDILVEPLEDGSFSYETALEVGTNSFTITYLEESVSCSVNRFYTTEYYSQAKDTRYGSGAVVYTEVFARTGSTVTVNFRGEDKKAEISRDQLGSGVSEGFTLYTCKFALPSDNDEDLDLGHITYTVTCDGITETFTSGTITCSARVKTKSTDIAATPIGKNYRDVGSGYIVEIIDVNVETFDGGSYDDYSRPTNNYLPKGTVDYGAQGTIYNATAQRTYIQLRCGIRVYQKNKNTPYYGQTRVVDCYTGTLPDHNEITVNPVTVEDHFTYLTLDCLWKAPFFFDEELQDFENAATRRYLIEEYTATYVDITFCYATEVGGDLLIPEDNPLFSHAEWIKNESDHTLRLYLKEAGGFYGWNAYYNENDQLVFKFLNPVTVTQADNKYGADLTGVRIMLDVGHGGEDPGAPGYTSGGKRYREADLNLTMANMIKAELESIGATVIMNRTTEEDTVTQRERTQFLMEQAPDYCLCVHHNSHIGNTMNGYETGYFTTFSYPATRLMYEAHLESDLYWYNYLLWHYYYVARQTFCPIVLTENGYMSNQRDMDQIANTNAMQKKSEVTVQAIANFYLEMNGYPIISSDEE